MKAFLGVGLGYLVSSFVVAFYLAAALWGTQGTVLALIIMLLFPLIPFWFASTFWWSPLAAFAALLVVTALFFGSVFGHAPRPWGRIAAAVAVFVGGQGVAAPVIIAAFGARHGSDATYARVMIASVILQLVLAVILSVWNRRREQHE